MANTLITPSMIAKEGLMHLKNNCEMGKLVNRSYKKEFVEGVGRSVDVRLPVKFQAQDGATRVNQDVVEGSTSIDIDKRKHVSWEFDTEQLTLDISEYGERYIKPAMIELAQHIDTSCAMLYKDVPNLVGTPGTLPATFDDLAAAALTLDNCSVPGQPRSGVFSPAAYYKLASGLKDVYVQGIAKEAIEGGTINQYVEFDQYKSQSVRLHTVGALGGTPLVNGASQSTTYLATKDTDAQDLVTDGWSNSITGVLKAGDVITIAGVFAVNPVTRQSTGVLRNFVVKEDASSNGSGQATLKISPAIIITGAYQTVTAAPADNAAITIKTGSAGVAYPQNLLFHKNAFALVTVPLKMPEGVTFKAQESSDGYSVRVIKDYSIESDKEIIRLDIFYGVKTLYKDFAVRMTS